MSRAGNRLIAPMLATPGPPPEDTDGLWAAEMKYDGCRILAAVGGDRPPVLWTRNLTVVTSSYPEVTEALTAAFGGRGRIVFDGELVALTQGGPSFARLQKRMHTVRPGAALRRQVPATFLPFDVLSLDGEDLTHAPYLDRRAALADLAHQLPVAGLPIQVPPHWVQVESEVILAAARDSAMEGAVFKKVSSIYLPGQRTRSWRKVLLRNRISCIILGWIPGEGGCAAGSGHWCSAPTTTTTSFSMWARSEQDSAWPCAGNFGRSWPSWSAAPVRSGSTPRPWRSTRRCAGSNPSSWSTSPVTVTEGCGTRRTKGRDRTSIQ